MNIDILSNKFIQDGIVKIENFINDEELNYSDSLWTPSIKRIIIIIFSCWKSI